jgi:hypothetical protein
MSRREREILREKLVTYKSNVHLNSRRPSKQAKQAGGSSSIDAAPGQIHE